MKYNPVFTINMKIRLIGQRQPEQHSVPRTNQHFAQMFSALDILVKHNDLETA